MNRAALYHELTKHRKVASLQEALAFMEERIDKEKIYHELTRHRDLMSLKEAAAYLKVGSQAIVRFVREEGLPAEKVAGRWCFQKQTMDHWMEDRLSGKTPDSAPPADPNSLS